MSRALDFFRKSTAQNATATSPAASRSEVVQSGAQNNSDCSHALLKSSPSYPSYPGLVPSWLQAAPLTSRRRLRLRNPGQNRRAPFRVTRVTRGTF